MDQGGIPTTRPFLLMEGGPLYRIEHRIGLAQRQAHSSAKISSILPLITWLPLLILTLIKGTAFGNAVQLPFLSDFGAYTRFLIAIPLFLVAENVIGPLVAEAAEHFIVSGVIGQKDYPAFVHAVEEGLRWRDSVVAEIIIVLLAYALAISFFVERAVHVSTWYATHTDSGVSPTLAGWWLLLFCMPLLQFLVLRWIWRIFLWFQFLNRMSRLDLNLYPTHPDEAGGLGFVGETQRLFSILLFTYSTAAAGVIANEILYDHAHSKALWANDRSLCCVRAHCYPGSPDGIHS